MNRHKLFLLFFIIVFSFAFEAEAAAPAFRFTVTVSEAVNVTTTGGTPRIALDVGGQTRYASYTSGTGTSALTFTYTATAGDLDLDGIGISSPIDLNGGAIADLAGNAIDAGDLVFTPPDTSNVNISYPSLSMNFTSGSTGTYSYNGTVYNSFSAFQSASSTTFTNDGNGTYFDSSGVLQQGSTNTPRFDHDPVTLEPKGILIEEARTNEVPNNTMQGALVGVIGSGGSLPTGWGDVGWDTLEVLGIGDRDGVDTITIRGTIDNSGGGSTVYPGIYLTPTNSIAASSGETWTGSIWSEIVSKTGAGTSELRFQVSERDSGGGYLNSVTFILSNNPSWGRYLVTRAFNNASTAYAGLTLSTGVFAGASMDVTFVIGLPQLEEQSFATSAIKTSGSAVTRAADVFYIDVDALNLGSGYTAYMDANMVQNVGNFDRLIQLDNGSSNNRHTSYYSVSGGYFGFNVYDSGVSQGGIFDTTGIGLGDDFKHAFRLNTNDANVAFDGVLGGVDTSVTYTEPTNLYLGASNTSANSKPVQLFFRELKLYEAPAIDAQLQLLTAP